MSHADLHEATLRIKRWAKAAEDAGVVKGGAKPEVRHSPLWPVASRWRVYERARFSLDGTPDGPKVDTDACVAAAQSWGEALMKYSLWAKDEGREAQFRDRHMRGDLGRPPIDPPEWNEHRAAQVNAMHEAGERAREWVRRSVQAQMAHVGLSDPVKFNAAWLEARAKGLIK